MKIKISAVKRLRPQPTRTDITDLGNRTYNKCTWLKDSFIANLGLQCGYVKHGVFNGAHTIDYFLYKDGICVGNIYLYLFASKKDNPEFFVKFNKPLSLVSPHVWFDKQLHNKGLASYMYKHILQGNVAFIATDQTLKGSQLWERLLLDSSLELLTFDPTENKFADKSLVWAWNILTRKSLVKAL